MTDKFTAVDVTNFGFINRKVSIIN